MEAGFRSTNWQELSFAIVGLGLIGGSYAKALRVLGAKQIIGVERSEETLAQAKELGIIDLGMTAADERLAQADVVICAIYPEAIANFIKSNVANFKKDVLITDVAGIKNNMIAEVQKALLPGMCCPKAWNLSAVIPWPVAKAAALVWRMQRFSTMPIILSCLKRAIARLRLFGWRPLPRPWGAKAQCA